MTVFELLGKIVIDNSQANKSIEGTSKKASVFGEVLKANLASEAIISGAKKLATAVTEIGKAAYENYSEYEQLAGGAELMFGEAYNAVAKNAKNAYKTVQMSQNEYLTQVNGLATGLKTALGGNAEAAAELAHKVVTAEADVVAATGNSQEAVQNAFNGIMKSNYTMLDNLQLGITPTKEGFQQLIDKVNEWNAANGNATNYTIDNLADAQSALVDYIEMQGLAGYAANEAADTIQGSTAAMKAAWQNLTTGMADETADTNKLARNFVNSVEAAANNIIPRIGQIIAGVGSATVNTISYIRETNEAADLLISAFEGVAVAAGAAFAAIKVTGAISAISTVFKANAAALAYFATESGKAAVAQAALEGTFSLSELAIGVLTGKISLATAAQSAWNAVIAANPLTGIAAACAVAATAIYGVHKAQQKQVKEAVGVIQTYEEAADKVEELKRKVEQAKIDAPVDPAAAQMLVTYKKALAEAQEQLEKFRKEREQNEIDEAKATIAARNAARTAMIQQAQAAADPANKLKQATTDYYTAVNALMTGACEVYQKISENVSGWFSPFEKVTQTVKVSLKDMMTGMQSQIDFFSNYSENIQTLTEAGLGGFAEQLQALGTEGAVYAQAIVDAMDQAGGATSEGGQKIVKDLTGMQTQLEKSQTGLVESMTLGTTDLSTQLQQLTNDYKAQVADWDKSGEASASATNTMNAFIGAIASGSGQLMSQMTSIGERMSSALQSGISAVTITVDVVMGGGSSVSRSSSGGKMSPVAFGPGFAKGLDYVPYDEFPAVLHEGEAVLTAAEARAWRAGKAVGGSGADSSGESGGSAAARGITIVQNIEAVAQTPVELAAATEAYFTQARWAM